jgi:hypothetical protein
LSTYVLNYRQQDLKLLRWPTGKIQNLGATSRNVYVPVINTAKTEVLTVLNTRSAITAVTTWRCTRRENIELRPMYFQKLNRKNEKKNSKNNNNNDNSKFILIRGLHIQSTNA